MAKQKFKPLAELETEIMTILWDLKNASVRAVVNRLRKKREVAYTTIMTTMSRLYTKGVLQRNQDASGAYIYTPTEDKQNFFAHVSGNVINNLLNNFGDVAVAQFIDILENSRYNTAEWRKKLKNIK